MIRLGLERPGQRNELMYSYDMVADEVVLGACLGRNVCRLGVSVDYFSELPGLFEVVFPILTSRFGVPWRVLTGWSVDDGRYTPAQLRLMERRASRLGFDIRNTGGLCVALSPKQVGGAMETYSYTQLFDNVAYVVWTECDDLIESGAEYLYRLCFSASRRFAAPDRGAAEILGRGAVGLCFLVPNDHARPGLVVLTEGALRFSESEMSQIGVGEVFEGDDAETIWLGPRQ